MGPIHRPISIFAPGGKRSKPSHRPDHLTGSPSGSSATARDPVTNDTTLMGGSSLHLQTIDSKDAPVLRILDRRRAPDAEVDSYARHPPPRCHPGSRKELRERITRWLLGGMRRDWNLVWLEGPAGVGKSAIAQSIAEECQEMGRLGASFFFSRLRNCTDPCSVLPTLAYRLAVHDAGYREAITQIIVEDHSILDKNLRIQFEKLIVDPFNSLRVRNLPIFQQPLLIVLDGLDECSDKAAQRELMELIGGYARSTEPPPLLWMICSRMEAHLKWVYESVRNGCNHEELTFDATEAEKDVDCLLRDGFKSIRDQHPWIVQAGSDGLWPTEAQLQRLAKATDGLFALASNIPRFVGDPKVGNPKKQLEICLSLLENVDIPNTVNPWHGLDPLYHHIMLGIPQVTLPDTKRILAFHLFSSPRNSVFDLDVQTLANLLGLTRGTFYGAFRELHSVLRIPPPALAHKEPLGIFHASYRDFLRDSARSGEFALNEADARCNIAVHLIQLYNSLIQANCKLPNCPFTVAPFPQPKWFAKGAEGGFELAASRMRDFVTGRCWEACCEVIDRKQRSIVIEELRKFNFCHIEITDTAVSRRLAQLAEWLNLEPNSTIGNLGPIQSHTGAKSIPFPWVTDAPSSINEASRDEDILVPGAFIGEQEGSEMDVPGVSFEKSTTSLSRPKSATRRLSRAVATSSRASDRFVNAEQPINTTALGDHFPSTLRSEQLAPYIATMSAEQQEALEMEIAQKRMRLRLQKEREAMNTSVAM